MVLENNYGKEDVLLDSTAGCVLSGRLPVAFRGRQICRHACVQRLSRMSGTACCRFGWIMQWLPTAVFYGTVLRNGTPVVDAPRGGVLNARILWSFSAAYRTFKDEAYLKLADKSQRYFIDTFIDKEHGGVYWLVNPDGEVLNASKYTYAMTYAMLWAG